jgi:hypothetical protein
MNKISDISALNYLSSRLENFKTDTINSSDYKSGHSTNNKNENLELRIQNSDVSYLLLKDSVDQYTRAVRLQFKDAIWDNVNNKIIGKPSWQNTEPDYAKAYKL